MELKYIVMTIIKILISVPSILLVITFRVDGAALMGGHLDNTRNSTSFSNFTSESYEMYDDSQEYFVPSNSTDWEQPATNYSMVQNEKQPKSNQPSEALNQEAISEEIPDPSALVLPGYNLPENIFNNGKPFYLEKDPLTGKVDFDSRTSLLNVDEDEFDYVDDDPHGGIYDKSNIDRKDGSLASHKASDVNQLTPNFHDFLNLPVKYNADKYVYPLISSSYANTKVQGNLNKYQSLNNHKSYVVTTYKPTVSPTYYTLKTPFFDPNDSSNNQITHKVTTISTTTAATTTTTRPTTTKPVPSTTKPPNLMNSGMIHPSFEDYSTPKPRPEDIYLTTKSVDDIYLTTKRYPPSSTTRRTLSLFEQLFGEYDDITTTETPFKPPSLFQNLPNNRNKYNTEEDTVKPERPEENKIAQDKDYRNILTGSNMGHENAYEYEDDYGNLPSESENNVHQTKPVKYEMKTTLPSSSTTSPRPPLSTTTPSTVATSITTKTTTRTTTTSTTTPSPIIEPESSTDYDPSMAGNNEYELEFEESGNFEPEYKKPPTTEQTIMSTKVTSLPLGENHFGTQDLRPPIIAMTHNLKEQLNNEKVLAKPFGHPIPSSSNIRISPDQDSVSFVVGNHQNVGGGFVGTSFKEGPFDNSPFRPLIVKADNDKDTVTYTVQAKPEFVKPEFFKPEFVKPIFSQNFPEPYKPQPKIPEVGGSSVNIQPIRTSEASLSIGVPINGIKKVPGQVVDENLENEKIEFPKKGTGAKIVFPDDKEEKISTFTPDLIPPPKQALPPNREILQLNSKPMYHQLPSNLTPPNEQDLPVPHLERPRPPWDPRPGHFYNGRPEYIRPPRPQAKPAPGEMYKRIDNLPNVPPMFRPTANGPHYLDYMGSMKNGYIRQALLERPSNRPIGLFEKLVPPPPSKNVHTLRKVSILEHDLRMRNADDLKKHEQYEFYQHQTPPPQPLLSNRRKTDEPAIETLQMIQAKQVERKEVVKPVPTSAFKTNLKGKVTSENPLYVVYPVTSAIKLDVIDPGKKETVVIGTRAELPLRPSKINQEFSFENPQDRNDSPILKPHPKPAILPIKSDFPYLLERPDIAPMAVTFSNSHAGNNLDLKEDSKYASNNQWGALQDTESRILTGSKINYKNPNQISVTLKTYTEKPKPIAVAYTPTEPYKRLENTEKYSLPNYADPVISEIRPSGLIDKKAGSEITVGTVIHTHSQMDLGSQSINGKPNFVYDKKILENHKIDLEESPPKLDFQAPFQASVNVDGMSQGWTVVRNDNKSKIDRSDQGGTEETTTAAIATTSEFDIENFKPQLFGGFKPLYSYPEEASSKSDETEFSEREERPT